MWKIQEMLSTDLIFVQLRIYCIVLVLPCFIFIFYCVSDSELIYSASGKLLFFCYAQKMWKKILLCWSKKFFQWWMLCFFICLLIGKNYFCIFLLFVIRKCFLLHILVHFLLLNQLYSFFSPVFIAGYKIKIAMFCYVVLSHIISD